MVSIYCLSGKENADEIQDGREEALPGFDQLDHPERYFCVKRKEKGGEEVDTFDQTRWWRLKQTAAHVICEKRTKRTAIST